MTHLLAVDTSSVIGVISPPVNDPLYTATDPNQAISSLISFGIQIFFFIAGVAMLIYLLWGAFDWITSEGSKEKVQKAQNKIMYAVIGMVLMVVVVVVFNVIMGTVLGGQFGIGSNMQFTLPTIK
jgi:magnesium-transporting ATPase (P-type)